MIRFVWLAVVLVALSACGPALPSLNFSVPNVGASSHRLEAEVRSLTVTLARPDEATGNILAGAEELLPLWKDSLEDALNRMAIFKDDGPMKLSFSVKVRKLNVPPWGASVESAVGARYELIDRNSGSVVFSTDVESTGHVEATYAFMGTTRSIEAINRAVQNNILQFLQQLETVDLGKPMYPKKPMYPNKPAADAGGKPTS